MTGRDRADGDVKLGRGEEGGVASEMTIDWGAAGLEGAVCAIDTLEEGTAPSKAGLRDTIVW